MKLKIYKLDSLPNEEALCILSTGDHVVGRGALFMCEDKRVSRNQAIIKITKDEVTITSTHFNPCYYQLYNNKTLTILPKDVEKSMTTGDKFGLFPDQYWFRVEVVPEDNVEISNVQNIECLEENSNDSFVFDIDGQNYQKTSSFPTEDIDNVQQNLIIERDDQQTQGVNDSKNINEESSMNNQCTASTLKKEEMSSSEDESTEVSKNNQEGKEGTTNCSQEEIKSEHPSEDITIKSEEVTSAEAELIENGENESNNDDHEMSSTQNGPSTSNKRKCRDKCFYGKQCYRKNPAHKSEFSHPDDSDYDSNPNDGRPECSYGAACYRKNKLHRQQYKHPRSSGGPPAKQPYDVYQIRRLLPRSTRWRRNNKRKFVMIIGEPEDGALPLTCTTRGGQRVYYMPNTTPITVYVSVTTIFMRKKLINKYK